MAFIGEDLALDGASSVRVDGTGDDGASGRSFSLRGFTTGDPSSPVNIKVHGAPFDPAAAGASVGPVVNVILGPGEQLHVGATVACTVAVIAQGVGAG